MEILLVNLAGILLLMAIIGWFWLAKTGVKTQMKAGHVIEIIVEGGTYLPDTVEAQKNQDVTLQFIRKDESPCAEGVIFSELGVSYDLPVGKSPEFVLKVEKPGIYDFTCPMGMYRGKLVIR